MKIFSTVCLLLLAGSYANGQTVVINGKVSNAKGQPVAYAFVRDAGHNYATFADSAGVFKLKAYPSSTLAVFADNYKDAQLKLDSKTDVSVVLSEGTNYDGVVSLKAGQQTQGTTFLQARQQLTAGSGVLGKGGGSDVTVVASGFVVEPTRGSRYLFEDWVPGFGLNKNDSLVFEKTNLYNFDKIDGAIVYTNDGRSMAQVSPSQLKSFTLYDKKGHAHVYENAPEINKKPFVEVLINTPKYKLYKKVDSKLTRANYHTDGLLETGHRYDEFTDVERYVFVSAADNKPQSISLKKGTLKKLFDGDADAFIAAQGSRDVDEEYVKDLGNSLNNK